MKKRIVVVLTAVCLLASCLFPAFSASAGWPSTAGGV